ncbi:MAG: metallophosphoesterase, partial [Methylococcales bacterium]
MNKANRILFAGDPHGNFLPVIKAVQEHQPEAVVLLGDYDLEKPLEEYLHEIMDMTQVWWIAGNHDFQTPGKYHNLFHSSLAKNELHLKVTEIAGLRIAGLSGIFLGRIWYPPHPPKWRSKQHYILHQQYAGSAELTLKYKSAIWHDEFEALKALKADILVSHEAPKSHRHGFHVIGELAEAMGVKTIFHGHLHENYASIIKKGIKVFGVADRAITDLHGNLRS